MTERKIFPDLNLFKKTVTEHFLVALREIYKSHPAYPYTEEDSVNTSIHIEPTYANLRFEGRNPQLLVKVGQYEFGLQDTLGQNLFDEVANATGVLGGYRSFKNMSTMVSIVVNAYAEEESSDLADELAMLGVYAAHDMFTQVGLNIRGSAVSETVKSGGQDDQYQTIVNFSVDVPWQLTTVNNSPATDPDFGIDIPDLDSYGYRQPGVYTAMNK